MYVVADGVAFWLELKCGIIKNMLIRKEQRLWGMQHQAAGGRSYFLYFNIKDNVIEVYENPIKKISVSGRYLAVHDEPIGKFSHEDILQGLLGILKS